MIAGRPVATLASLIAPFGRLGAAVGPEDLVEVRRGRLRQQLGGAQHRRVGEDVRLGVDDAGGLLLDGRDDARVAVAGVDDRDAGGEVGVALAVDIPDVDALAVVDMERRVAPDDAGHDLRRIRASPARARSTWAITRSPSRCSVDLGTLAAISRLRRQVLALAAPHAP